MSDLGISNRRLRAVLEAIRGRRGRRGAYVVQSAEACRCPVPQWMQESYDRTYAELVKQSEARWQAKGPSRRGPKC